LKILERVEILVAAGHEMEAKSYGVIESFLDAGKLGVGHAHSWSNTSRPVLNDASGFVVTGRASFDKEAE